MEGFSEYTEALERNKMFLFGAGVVIYYLYSSSGFALPGYSSLISSRLALNKMNVMNDRANPLARKSD